MLEGRKEVMGRERSQIQERRRWSREGVPDSGTGRD